MTQRSKLLSHKIPKQEQELHIITNPLLDSSLHLDDYEPPATAKALVLNSKWIIVRNNIHKIRSWGGIQTDDVNHPFPDWYLFFQMRRELRRIKENIKQVENQPDFVPPHYFYLPTDKINVRRYNVSHIKPSDALYYSGFGREPIVLQSLLYYFSKECFVPHNSIFLTFLTDICSIINRDRRRLDRAAVFRKVALIIAMIVFVILGLMLFSLILSVLKTTSDLTQMYQNDPTGGIGWQQPETTISSL